MLKHCSGMERIEGDGCVKMAVSVHICLVTPLMPKSINIGVLVKFDHLVFVTCGYKLAQASIKGISRHKWA